MRGGETGRIATWAAVGAAAFHLSYAVPAAAPVVLLHPWALLHLGRGATPRGAFYGGLAAGLLVVAPHLWFFLALFGPAGASLWLVVAFWTGLFTLLASQAIARLRPVAAAVLVPFLWTGLEYFRSELYPLRFTWVTPGFAFPPGSPAPALLGVYGIGFVAAATGASLAFLPWRRGLAIGTAAATALSLLCLLGAADTGTGPGRVLRVAGLQLEGVDEASIPHRLDLLLASHPGADLIVLPEYAFTGEPTAAVRSWCRRHRRHLVAGGRAIGEGKEWSNTAFVVGPDGEIAFRQAKCVPIQFFEDGLPAAGQEVWASPFGAVGICICYDLGYSRVVDRLVAAGAEVLVVPTLDAEPWGRRQHELHARVAPARAAECGVPIVRVASSGISQVVDARGRVLATAPFAGRGAAVSGEARLRGAGRVPWDRVLATVAVAAAAAWVLRLLEGVVRSLRGTSSSGPTSSAGGPPRPTPRGPPLPPPAAA